MDSCLRRNDGGRRRNDGGGWVGLVEDGDDIAGGVPELVGEVAAGPNLGLAEAAVVAGGGADGEGKAEGVGAVLVDDFEGIEDVALDLAHLLAVFVLDEAVEIDGVEGYIAHVLDAEHDHAGDPEEEDVVACFEDCAGVEVAEVGGVVGPAEGGVGPEAGAEPCVQDVGVLANIGRATTFAGCWVIQGDGEVFAQVAVPDGDTVAPPELAADAPVADVVHPVEVDLGEAVGDYADAALGDGAGGGLSHWADLDEPLLTGHRFDDGVAALAVAYGVGEWFCLSEQAIGFEVLEDAGSALCDGQAGVLGPAASVIEDWGPMTVMREGCGAGRYRSRWDRGLGLP